MVKFFSQSYVYDDPWPLVTLAFFLRYPNPMSGHVMSCDVISRTISPSGSLFTTRLIRKRGALPKWFPKGMISQAESWIIEDSEVDVQGRVLKCTSKNLDHVKVMQVVESVELKDAGAGGAKTVQKTEARFVSRFGWGLTKRIEIHGLTKFKTNIERSREGLSMVLRFLRESRPHLLTAPHLAYATATGSAAVFDSDDGLRALYTHHDGADLADPNSHRLRGAHATDPIPFHHVDDAQDSYNGLPSRSLGEGRSASGLWSKLKSYFRRQD